MPLQPPRPLSAVLARGLVSRRSALGMAGLATAGVLAGCGSAGKNPTDGASPADQKLTKSVPDLSDTDKVLNWSNWPEYIDLDDRTRKRPSLDRFTKKTGIKVKYTEDYNDNDEFYAKVRPLLEAGNDTGRDLWVSSDWLVARLIRMDYLQRLDVTNIPNHENFEPDLVSAAYDPGRLYSVPWQSGFTGVAYNPRATGGHKVESVEQLLTDPALKGKVTLLSEMQDTVPMVMIDMGIDPAAFTDADFDAACATIRRAKDSGQIKAFTGNDYTKPLAAGDTAACLAWTGDIVQLQADNPDLGYALPDKGFLLWSDNFVIPNLARHKLNAERLINYYYDPAVMARVVDYVNYVAPVTGAKEALVADDPEVADNPLIFPSPAVLSRGHDVRPLTAEEETRYNRAFQSIVQG